MQKNKDYSSYILVFLVLILFGIMAGTGRNIVRYYTGPGYQVDTYIRSLKNKDYKALYNTLETASAKQAGSEKDVLEYYKKVYEVQNKLYDVKVTSCRKHIYELQYIYKNREEKGRLQLVKEGTGWRILFPFNFSQVEIFGPSGCEVYLDGQKLREAANGRYIGDYILPASYMLQVRFPLKNYKNYYKVMRIPEEKVFELPYETGTVSVYAAQGMKAELGSFKKDCNGGRAVFPDLLPGSYELRVEDAEGNFIPQQQIVELKERNNICYVQDYTLSETGNERCDLFFEQFYAHYAQAVQEHQIKLVSDFIGGAKRKAVLNDFYQWYIDKKDVRKADLAVDYGSRYVDKKGKLHQESTETFLLYNKEKGEEGEETTNIYKVKISWDNMVNVMGSRWQIEDRRMLESIVAVKDREGRWVQY